MLWQRVATAVILLPLVLLALFKLPVAGIVVLIGAVVMLAAWELSALTGFHKTWQRALFLFAVFTAGAAGSIWILQDNDITIVLVIACVWWAYAVVHIVREDGSYSGMFGSPGLRVVAGFLVLVPTWLGFILLYATDRDAPLLLLYLLVLVWVADSFAYFAGKAWGRHKLVPAVSPGKSIEGVAAAMVGVLLVAYVAGHHWLALEPAALAWWVVCSLLAGAFSVVGDLAESIFKRRAGVKDSGHLLPGHGGMFDRIDALTAAIPVFALEWTLFQKVAW